jgi:hypothetical protein
MIADSYFAAAINGVRLHRSGEGFDLGVEFLTHLEERVKMLSGDREGLLESLSGIDLRRAALWADLHIDFVIAGFEKCGTNFIAYHLDNMTDVMIWPQPFLEVESGTTTERCSSTCESAEVSDAWCDLISDHNIFPTKTYVDRLNDQIDTDRQKRKKSYAGTYCALLLYHLHSRLKLAAMGVKVILSIRDPIDYLVAHYRWRKRIADFDHLNGRRYEPSERGTFAEFLTEKELRSAEFSKHISDLHRRQ